MTVDPQNDFPTLDQNINCDVCIIGAGIAELTAAYMLDVSEIGQALICLVGTSHEID